jgi:hypothetical protein
VEGCCDSEMTRNCNDRRYEPPAQQCGIVGAASLIIFLVFVSSSMAKDGDKPEISTACRDVAKKIQQLDQTLDPLVIEYHKSGNSQKLEPKIDALFDQREKRAKKFLKSIESDRSDLGKQLARSDKTLETLYERLARLEKKGSQMDIKKANAAYDAERSHLQLIREALEESFALSNKLEHYELPKNIGLPGGAVTELPVFGDGPSQGYFMHYTGKGYDAVMDGNGVVHIRVEKPDSNEVYENKISIGPYMHGGPSSLKVMGFVPPSSKPLKQPQQAVMLLGFAMNYTQFALDYKFTPTSVTVSSGYRVPIDVSDPIDYKVEFEIPGAVGDVSEAELILKVIKEGKLKRTVFPYDKSHAFDEVIKSATIRGHWGPGEIEIKPKGTRERFVAHKAPKGPVHEGYKFRFSPETEEFARRKSSVTLTFVPPHR